MIQNGRSSDGAEKKPFSGSAANSVQVQTISRDRGREEQSLLLMSFQVGKSERRGCVFIGRVVSHTEHGVTFRACLLFASRCSPVSGFKMAALCTRGDFCVPLHTLTAPLPPPPPPACAAVAPSLSTPPPVRPRPVAELGPGGGEALCCSGAGAAGAQDEATQGPFTTTTTTARAAPCNPPPPVHPPNLKDELQTLS